MPPYDPSSLAPRFRDELNDLDLMQSEPARALDPRYMSLRRQATSPNNPFLQAWDENSRAQNMRNRAQVFRNQAMRDLSDRDIQMRNMEDEQAFRRQMAEREFGLKEKDMQYRRQQDEQARKDAERNAKAQYFQGLMRSEDEFARLEGEQGLRSLYEGGQTPTGAGAPSPAPVQGGMPGAATEPAPGTYAARVKALQEKHAAQQRAEAEDREFKKRVREEDFAGRKLTEAEQRRDRQMAPERARLERVAGDPSRSPEERAAAERRLAQMASILSPTPNIPTSAGMGMGNVFKALSQGYEDANQQTQQNIADDPAFNVNPLAQRKWEAQQKIGALGTEEQAVDQAMQAVGAEDDIQQAVYDMAVLLQKEQTSGNISPDEIASATARFEALADDIAARTSMDRNSILRRIKSRAMTRLMDQKPSAGQTQIRARLRGEQVPQAAGRAAAFGGMDAGSFVDTMR